MKDEKKTKRELIGELQQLRQKIGLLESADSDGKMSIEDIQESEERFRRLSDAAFEAIVISDRGKVIEANNQAAELLGYTMDEFIGIEVKDLVAPDSLDYVMDQIKRGVEKPYEHMAIKKDGTIFPVEVHGKAIPYKGRKVRVTAIKDLTERWRAAESLWNEKRFTEVALNAQLDTFFVFNPVTGEPIRWNKAFSEVTGYSDEEIAKMKAPDDWYEEEDLKKAITVIGKISKKGHATVELSLVTRDGRRIPTEYRASLINDSEGNPRYIISIGRDITERIRAEEGLRRYESIVSSSTDMLALLDRNFVYLAANDSYLKAFGKSRSELIGHTVAEIFGDTFFEITIKPKAEQCLRGEEVRYYGWFDFPEAGTRYMEITYYPYFGYGNEIEGFVVNGRDSTERKRAEDELRALSSRNEAMLESIPDIIMEVDNEKVYTWANKPGYEFFGDDVIGRKASDYFEGEQDTYKMVEPLFRGEEDVIYVESWQRRRDGEIRLLAWWCKVLKDGSGNPAGALSTARDITEQRQAEIALRESAINLTKAQVIAKVGHWSLDLETNKVDGSDELFHIFGLTREEATLDAFIEVVHPEDRKNLSHLKRGIELGENWDIEHRIIYQDGTEKFVHAIGEAVVDETGKTTHFLGIVQDITEHKIAEEAVRASEEKLQSITSAAKDAIIMADDLGKIVFCNPAAEEIFGYSKQELFGQSLWEIVIPDQFSETISDRILKFGRTGDDESIGDIFEMIFKRKNGDEFPVEISLSALRLANRWHSVAVIRDITEIKRLRELESRAERLKTAGQIAGQVAHDFNNLLGPLIAYPELAKDELPEGHTVLSYLKDIENSAKQIADINQQLLTLGRRSHYNLEPVNLNNIIHDVIKDMRNSPSTLFIEANLEEKLMNIMAGRAQIHRVLSNLLRNARDSMQDIGKITVTSENCYIDNVALAYGRIPKGEYVMLTITDSGCGIPDDLAQKIFDPFFTTKSADKKRGSGLGLSVVDAVVKDHKGFIDLSSTLGEGTSFYLYFPITRELITVQECSEISGGNEAILVIDDDEMQRKVTVNILQNLGYKVTAIESGEKAVGFLKNNPQDLLILDMIMPNGIDGAETYRRVLEINPDQKAIIVSGFAESEKVHSAQQMGAGPYIRKPLTIGQMASAIRNELDKAPVKQKKPNARKSRVE